MALSTTSTLGSAVAEYLTKCKDLGFDVIEVSGGFISPTHWLRSTEKVQAMA